MMSWQFQLQTWARILCLSAVWVISSPVIVLVFIVRRLADCFLRPAAARIPRPGDVVVVTGASTGIGESIAIDLHRRGFRVLAGVRQQPDYDRLQSLGLQPIHLDVNHLDQIAAVLQAVPAQAVLAAVICNAGVCVPGPLEDQSDDVIREMIDVNVGGAIFAAKAFLPRLRRDGGRLIFTGSVSGYLPQPAVTVYTATKFALRGLALALAQEVRPCGVSVSVIEPAQTSTPIFDKAQAALERLPSGPVYAGLVHLVSVYSRVLGRLMATQPSRSTDAVLYRALTDRRPALRYPASWMATLHEFMAEFPAEASVGEILTTAYRAAYGLEHGWSH